MSTNNTIDPIWILGRLAVSLVAAAFLYTMLLVVVIVADGSPFGGPLLMFGWVAFTVVTTRKLFELLRP